jgi:2-polyprenyl-6-methoxyphenol hydroxylase-like FAD-dependent oxidoreductase
VRDSVPTSVALLGVRRRQATQGRVALVGSAAQNLHPVAGQGLNLGIRDVCVLAELVSETLSRGQDPGAPACLQAFVNARRKDREMTAAATDFLAWGFGPRLLPLNALRSFGLGLLDVVTPAKRHLALRAMGLAAPVPRLMRGLPLRGLGPGTVTAGGRGSGSGGSVA